MFFLDESLDPVCKTYPALTSCIRVLVCFTYCIVHVVRIVTKPSRREQHVKWYIIQFLNNGLLV